MPRDDKGLDEYDSIFTLSSYTIEILQSALTQQNLSYYERGNSKNGTEATVLQSNRIKKMQ